MNEVIWQEPERNNRGRVNKRKTWFDTLELELRRNAGKWALIHETDKSRVVDHRFRGGEFERAYRIVSHNNIKKYRIYARFVAE